MKVYVMTRAKPLRAEEFVDVKASFEEAEKAFRQMYPFMRKTGDDNYISERNIDRAYLLWIREKKV